MTLLRELMKPLNYHSSIPRALRGTLSRHHGNPIEDPSITIAVGLTLLREPLKSPDHHSTIWHQILKWNTQGLKSLVPYSAMVMEGFQELSQ